MSAFCFACASASSCCLAFASASALCCCAILSIAARFASGLSARAGSGVSATNLSTSLGFSLFVPGSPMMLLIRSSAGLRRPDFSAPFSTPGDSAFGNASIFVGTGCCASGFSPFITGLRVLRLLSGFF